MSYALRPIHAEDIDFLREMLYLAIYTPPGKDPPTREMLDRPEVIRYVEGWGREGDDGFIAVHQETGAPVGAAWYRCGSAESPGYAFIDPLTPEVSIAIRPEHRNQGLGTELMQALIEQARKQYKQLSLSCDPNNPACRLYERLGFSWVAHSHTMILPL